MTSMQYGKPLACSETEIPQLLLWDLPVYGDNRGWFKENWQREEMARAGLPDFEPVQNNVSFNDGCGTTRGFHAEPWDKFVSVSAGRVFGAWVDLRAGPSFGVMFTANLDPSRAVFVPRGVGNAYQTLERSTVYSYLVNDHWTPDVRYTSVNLADETLAIEWPIPLEHAEISVKDAGNPPLASVAPVSRRRTLVVGGNGQLGRALREILGNAAGVEFANRRDLDLTTTELLRARKWQDYETIINAAAYTAVDAAETREGRVAAWATNVAGVSALSRVASLYNLRLVHISSEYVFDGTSPRPYRESDDVAPICVYGQTKAAGDQIVATLPRHYILRTSWVIGDGQNFVRTMLSLAQNGVDPAVVNDQYGRLTFTNDLARAIRHLLKSGAPSGTYNITGSGPVMTWADVARHVFALAGFNPSRVNGVSTAQYSRSLNVPAAPRPRNGALDLTRLELTGFRPGDANKMLETYVREAMNAPSD